jgi:hydrogenase maturation protein HypF
MNLSGWVLNSAQGVFIEVEGDKLKLDRFLLRIENEKPDRSFIQSLEASFLDPVGFTTFEIRHSKTGGDITTIVLPDIATCKDCLREIFDPSNHRYHYPFTNCTNCGPRFSIIESLPYDRLNTTMKNFYMCEDCQHEYENPLDRRFHAQPNCCPKCGPHIELLDSTGARLSISIQALMQTAAAIRSGKIAAIKGLGGFLFMVDARNNEAVIRLRERKHREEKPFATMYPSLNVVKTDCEVSSLEERLLLSPESPIVLLKRISNDWRSQSGLSYSVAPNNPYLGVMMPYTPLYHILMRELNFPVVATSGNLSDEPICICEEEAIKRLAGIADIFLVHNRPIKRHVDDSIVRIMLGRELLLRRARGYAPLPIRFQMKSREPVMSLGAHLKNTIALTSGENVFISQHIGDLETKEAYDAFQNIIDSFKLLYQTPTVQFVSDLHPNYLSTQYAKGKETPVIQIQHHYAHIASCMADNQIDGRVLGISWDGTGYGPDGTIWGSEFLLTNDNSFEHVASFRQFKLPGGERAIKEPRRTAIGILFEIFGKDLEKFFDLPFIQSFSNDEFSTIIQMLERNLNSPITSSAGRLFDGVAALVGLNQRTSFEGQAAMGLEFAIGNSSTNEHYKWSIVNGRLPMTNIEHPTSNNVIDHHNSPSLNLKSQIIVDWAPMILDILEDVKRNTDVGIISVKFHNTLVEIILEIAKRIGEKRVVISGGCFQNKYLTEHAVQKLQAEGFHPYWHQRVPPNDGGISLGQIVAASKHINLHGSVDK